MASVAKRADGGWRARYRDAAGREHSKHFARKVDAQRWLDETTAAVLTGRYVDPKAGRITVEAFAEQWRATLVHRPGYLRIIDNALKNYILPTLGARPLSSLRRSDVQGFVSAIAQERSANSVHNIYRVLAQLMGAAVDDLLVPASPCARVKLPSRPSAEVKPPTPVEVADLAERISARQRALVILLAGTGLRISEALGLQVGDVDFLRGRCGLSVSATAEPRGSFLPRRAAVSAPCRLVASLSTSSRLISRPMAPRLTVRSSLTSSARR